MSKSSRYLYLTLLVYSLYLLGLLMWVSEGFTHFNYTLDDPYIHLQLARNIWNGHYGFNALEVSSPSSSILWPFLLAPFANVSFYEYVPLAFNLVLSLCCAGMFYRLYVRRVNPCTAMILALFSLLLINCFGLALTGLEHVLQILVVLFLVDVGLRDFPQKTSTRIGALVAILTLALTVRYEMLVFWAAFSGYFLLSKQYKNFFFVTLPPLLPVLGFSIFLKYLGLGFLPDSVLAKTTSEQSFLPGLLTSFFSNAVSGQGFVLLCLTILGLILLLRRSFSFSHVWVLVIPSILHLMVGKFGWFYRYEVYIFLYVGLLVFLMIPQIKKKHKWGQIFGWVVAFLIAFWPYFTSVKKLHQAIRNIRYQQGVTLDFVQNFLKEPIGINDIGLVGFRYHYPILDLWGLASKDALRMRLGSKDMNWISELAKAKSIQTLIIYETWLQPNPPWKKVGQFELLEKSVALAAGEVSVYAMPDNYKRVWEGLDAYSRSLVETPVKIVLSEK